METRSDNGQNIPIKGQDEICTQKAPRSGPPGGHFPGAQRAAKQHAHTRMAAWILSIFIKLLPLLCTKPPGLGGNSSDHKQQDLVQLMRMLYHGLYQSLLERIQALKYGTVLRMGDGPSK